MKERDVLLGLGVTVNYRGFYITATALQLCQDQPERLLMITKWLYPDIAKKCACSCCSVERNIRMAAKLSWEKNKALLESLAGRSLQRKPSNAQFLAILIASLNPNLADKI